MVENCRGDVYKSHSQSRLEEQKRARSAIWLRALAWLEQATRIELATSAWEADVLPLNYARNRVLTYYPTKRAKSQVFSKFERIFC